MLILNMYMPSFKEHGFVGSDNVTVRYSAKATCVEMGAQDIQDMQNRGWAKVGGSMLFHVAKPETRNKAQEHCVKHDSKLVEFWSEHEWNEVSRHFQSHEMTYF